MEVSLPWRGTTAFMWQPCDPCVERRERQYAGTLERSRATEEAGAAAATPSGLERVAHFTFDTFDAHWLLSRRTEDHPVPVAKAWLAALGDRPHGDVRDDTSPPSALYFYSPGKGRGKTHLAAAAANAARAQGKRVAFVEETTYLEQRWSRPLSQLEALTAYPGSDAWLTVIDDLGQRAKVGDSIADAWYAVINRRWLKMGWTIFTSNKLPDELLAQGTLNEATYSRLMQLIRKRVLFFHGEDRRLQ